MSVTWNIDRLECLSESNGQKNVVFNVHWNAFTSDGVNSASIFGVEPIEYDSNSSFISFEQLSKEIVVGWLHNTLANHPSGENMLQKNLNVLNKKLEECRKPVVLNVLPPWTEEVKYG